MEFVEELPSPERHIDSLKILKELATHPGQWGRFYVQEEEPDKTARGRIQSFRGYVTRNGIPVDVRSQKNQDTKKVEGWARWNEAISRTVTT